MIKSNCCNNKNRLKVTSPSGIWELDQLIGAKVLIKSIPVSNFFGTCRMNDLMTISKILFRVSLDGKAITIIELEEFPGKTFLWKDLEIVELDTSLKYKPICGEFLCGQAICGKDVDKNPSYLEDFNGIILIDENGNLINNRYVRFTNADVEDITTDNDDVTDTKFGGSLLDKNGKPL